MNILKSFLFPIMDVITISYLAHDFDRNIFLLFIFFGIFLNVMLFLIYFVKLLAINAICFKIIMMYQFFSTFLIQFFFEGVFLNSWRDTKFFIFLFLHLHFNAICFQIHLIVWHLIFFQGGMIFLNFCLMKFLFWIKSSF